MDASFWHEKWDKNQIAFHQSEAHPMLVGQLGALDLSPGARVFVPLCGKTLDIGWLLSQGFRVAGAELSQLAVEQLFDGLGQTPTITETGDLRRYGAEGVDIFVGDFFALTADALRPVDAVFDRAALVALPEGMRERYARHLSEVTGAAVQLLITFDYDQAEMDGPPFSVPEGEVRRHYEGRFDVSPLVSAPVEGGLKGKCSAMEEAWLVKAASRQSALRRA
ncbi:UNVERIFIED_CONTAM: hypothetical protein GTU68_054197 [Idotea baltica]|nr:hypothetical protein [Idotea baltica]